MCLDASESRGKLENTKSNKEHSENTTDKMDLRMHQLAGGNLIEQAPVFSADAE